MKLVTRFTLPALMLVSLLAGCNTNRTEEPAPKLPVTKESALKLAEKILPEYDIDVTRFSEPAISLKKSTDLRSAEAFLGKGTTDEWYIFYEGKGRTPGNHLCVVISAQTGKYYIVPGA